MPDSRRLGRRRPVYWLPPGPLPPPPPVAAASQNGTVDPKDFYDSWVLEVERSYVERRAAAVTVAATKIAAAYRGYARKKAFTMARMDKHFAAADIQRAWRKMLTARDECHTIDMKERLRRTEIAATIFETWVHVASTLHKLTEMLRS